MLPLNDASSARAPQRREWHVWAGRAPELPALSPFRSFRFLAFPTDAGALGGRVAPGRGRGARSAAGRGFFDRLAQLYCSVEPCAEVPATRERCDALADWGAPRGPPPLLPDEVPRGPGADATARALQMRLPSLAKPRWPAAGLRAYLRPVAPGMLVGSAWRGDGGDGGAEEALSEADEPAFNFVMLHQSTAPAPTTTLDDVGQAE